MNMVRTGSAWRRFQSTPKPPHGKMVVHVQYFNPETKLWQFFCSPNRNLRGKVVSDSERVTCNSCGRIYTD
jgi:hypothetical protein